MSSKNFPTFLLMFIFLIFIWGISCSKRTLKRTSNLKILDTEDQIFISGEKYQLIINKFDGFANLKNRAGIYYTSFPLHAQLESYSNTLSSSSQIDWQVKGKEITMLINIEGLPYQKIVIKPFSNAVEITFGIKNTYVDTTVSFFKYGQLGFDTDGWKTIFSPEPDNFYSSTPRIDVRVNRDRQWAFAPAPLNISFETEAGWFSVGLTKLPDASMFAFKDKAIYLDYPLSKFPPSLNIFYWLEPLVFTFNESPWDAIGDFQSYLIDHAYVNIDKDKEKSQPDWWLNPMVCTWGEQMMQDITYDKEGYNSDWVRNYVLNQELALDGLNFTLVIDDKWSKAYGDPYPDKRFKDLRKLIDWCHNRGHKVLLWWKAWKVEAKSLAAKLNIADREYIDATHSNFDAYIDTCCQIMLGNGEGQLNADGLRLDFQFLVRDPIHANYANPSIGMGIKELFHYMKILYKYAKKYKPESLITASAVDPHFRNVQDMILVNDDWDNKLRREKRARIIAQALPDMLINGDAADMYNTIAPYHYVTSSIYGVPSIYYLTRFHDGEISNQTKSLIAKILKLSTQKPAGKLEFVNYGNWRIIKNNEILAESLPQGKGIVIYNDDNSGTLLCTQNTSVHIVLNKKILKEVTDENGNKAQFQHIGQGIYELVNVHQGELYKLFLRKRMNIYE
ncbi:MAG: hypothetical protein JSW07_02890 [bacterium]|nr:MAG: hypothetical protein JSW07_02890 [bacterium]